VATPTIDEITEELREVTLQVHNAQERKEERDLVIAAQQGVDRLAQRYRELYASLSAGEQLRVDRLLGRRVVDVKRLASLLPKVASVAAESTPDRVAGTSTVGARRITGVSWTQDRSGPIGPKPTVGADIEAWCGKCGERTDHHIVALVGDEPKQVLCQVCNSRHAYRTTPTRRPAGGEAAAAPGEGRAKTPQDVESAKKAAELRTLQQEVAAATDIKTFDPKQRYKAGEIIFHPDFGRGKVENVLRSSLLVRFPIGGLKSLMLV
jgi:hypothetical protein